MFRPGRDKGIATPIPLGMATLGVATFLLGFALIWQPATQWGAYFGEAILIGGIAQFLAGMWAFSYGDPLAATLFTFAGSFYGWWGLHGIFHTGAVVPLTDGMVFIVCGAAMGCLWLASFYETVVFSAALLLLWVGWVLTGCALFAASGGVAVAAGAALILSGLVAAYDIFADAYNAATFEDRVPVGEAATARERAEQEELQRLRRLQSAINHQEIHVSTSESPRL
jgi:succinate-acetate transporter protein